MPIVHLYVRTQLTAADATTRRLVQIVDALQTTVTDAGGDWRGGITVVEEPPADAPPPEAPEPSAEGD